MSSSNALKITLVVAALMTAGCANTIRGVGQDAANTVNATQSAGKNVAGAAKN
jgi:entericidin B